MAGHRSRRHWWRKFLGLWFRFAFKEAFSAAFGWGTIPGAGVFALVSGALGLTMPTAPTPSEILMLALAATGAAWVAAFFVNLVVLSPRKAWLAMDPLQLIVMHQISAATFIQEVREKHVVSLTVRNRSTANSVFCEVLVSDIREKDTVAMPWQIYSANIPANDEHIVPLAQCFFWENEGERHEISILNERPGAFRTSSMIQLPQSSAEICVLARAPDCPEKTAWCRVSVQKRHLVLEKIDGPSH